MANKFYPPLSDLITIESLPQELNFLEGSVTNGIDALFSKMYYRNLRSLSSLQGGSSSILIDVVIGEELKLELPGTGIVLKLNSLTTGLSYIPISLNWSLPILKYINNFNLSNFSFEAGAFYDIVYRVKPISDAELVLICTTAFIDGVDPLEIFADRLRNDEGASIPQPLDSDTNVALQQIVDGINASALTTRQYILDNYILGSYGSGTAIENFNHLFSLSFGAEPVEYLSSLFRPNISARLALIPSIEFPRNVFKPLDQNFDEVTTRDFTLEINTGSGPIELFYSTNGGFGFDFGYGVSTHPDTPFAEIGNTGLLIGFTNIKLDLSKNTNIPEADMEGRSADFTGVFIEQASITLPSFMQSGGSSTTSIVGRNLLIGTGGISGVIGLENPQGLINVTVGEFVLSFNAFSITFKQNSIVDSNIRGKFSIPNFEDSNGGPVEIDIVGGFNKNGDFYLTFSEQQGIPIRIPEVLEINIQSLTLGKKEEKHYVRIIGEMRILAAFGTGNIPLMEEAFPIPGLIIWEDGKMEIEGGRIPLPKAFSLNVGPTKVSITALDFGTTHKMFGGNLIQYNYFGFSGGVSVNPGGVDVQGNGIKFYFSTDPLDFFLELDQIAIDIHIPGDVSPDKAKINIKGFLSIANQESATNPAPTAEYLGSVAFLLRLKKGEIGGGASMRLSPDVPAFIVDAFLELDSAIPLASTGLGIYGFRGLIGHRYVPSKAHAGVPDGTWWDYYKADPEGVSIEKFSQENGLSLGAGVSLGTMSDAGYSFSSKLMLILGMPDVLLLTGQAAILRERVRFSDTKDPPFYAMLALSEQSVEVGLGAHYLLPDSGAILDLRAEAEMAYFFDDPNAWYIHLGTEQKRVKSRILRLVNGYTYLMITPNEIKAGAGAGYAANLKFGPVRINLDAHWDVWGRISFKPVQLGGGIAVGAMLRISVFRFGFSLEAGAGLAAEAPKPFIVSGYMYVKIKLPWPFDDRKVNIDFVWIFNRTIENAAISPIGLPVSTGAVTPIPVNAVNVMSGETFPVNFVPSNIDPNIPIPTSSVWSSTFDKCVVPLDSFIDIQFQKPVKPIELDNIGGYISPAKNKEMVPPVKGYSTQIEHEYKITAVNIKIFNPITEEWEPYKVYDAVTAINSIPGISTSILKDGYWQLTDPYKYDKLRLLANNVFSYTEANSIQVENYGFGSRSIFCAGEMKNEHCVDWENQAMPTVYLVGNIISYDTIKLNFLGFGGDVLNFPAHGKTKGVKFRKTSSLEIYYPEAVSKIVLKLASNANNITIKYFAIKAGPNTSQGMAQPDYVLMHTENETFSTLTNAVVYENINQAIDKVLIEYDGGGDPITNTAPFRLGCRSLQQNGWYDGNMRDVIVGNTAFEPNEISSYFDIDLLPNGVVSHWKLDNSATITDYGPAGYSNHGINHGATIGSTGGKSYLSFDGQNDYVEVPHDGSISLIGEDFSMMAWIQTSDITTDINTIIDKRGSSGYHLFTWKGRICYQINIDGRHKNRASKTFVADGNWHHVAVTHYAETGETTIYVDKIAKETFIEEVPSAPGHLYLMETCYLNKEDYSYNFNLPTLQDIEDEALVMMDAMTKAYQPVWRPNSDFAIQIVAQDRVNGTDNNFYYNFGFRTKGPVGHFHQGHPNYDNLATDGKENQIVLATLKHYIDYSHSYPNADGKLTGAKPLYWQGPKLQLFFKHPYINAMFHNWDAYQGNPAINSRLRVSVIDPTNETIGEEFRVSTSYKEVNFSYQRADELLLANMIVNGASGGTNCVIITEPLKSYNYSGEYVIPDLKPSKLYTAVFNADFDGEEKTVHQYGFKTSAYSSFEEHINSYILSSAQGIKAIYAINFEPFNIAKAIEVFNGTVNPQDPLNLQFADPFDRLMDGAFRIGALNAVETTEFNILFSSVTGSVFGILVRSPEPFFDPKMPLDQSPLPVIAEINGVSNISSFSSFGDSGDPQSIQLLFSKDRASLFISTQSLNIDDNGPVIITFNNYTFELMGYETQESYTAEFDLQEYI